MLRIIDATQNIDSFFPDGRFTMDRWNQYMDTVLPLHKDIFWNDVQNDIDTGRVTFENDFLPVLNEALRNKDGRAKAVASFHRVSDHLEAQIRAMMGKSVDATVILYLGLCNGAGWVVRLDSRQYVLLGIEKIIELQWWNLDDMYGLIDYELGHIYHAQYGQLERDYDGSEAFLWQLYTEGIAMLFEQKLVGREDYFHQDKNGWADWCAAHLDGIMLDFQADLAHMTHENQRYFGDWVQYDGHGDTGYYLGAKFAQWLNTKYPFDDLIRFDLPKVQMEWRSYRKETRHDVFPA